ncbi:MAG: hypothetical protein LBI42_02505 [Chitinispirillales bacterium]|jgi:type II secretory pathway pseudopilin PulG|nr:hypothetical protein [Chitinispirillales bacterium]
MEKNIKTAGASIIEIMISMMIVAILLMAVAAVFPRMTAHRKNIYEVDQARIIAAEVIEGLQMLSSRPGGGCLDGGGTINGADEFMAQYANVSFGAVTYNVTSDLECGPSLPFSTATVTVKWSKSGKDHEIRVTGAVR